MIARPFRHVRLSRSRMVSAVGLLAVLVAALVAAAAVAAPASAATSEDYFFTSSFGPAYAPGDYFGEFGAGPNGIAADSAGNVYVTIPQGFVKYYASGTLACVYKGDNGYTAGHSYGLDVDSSGNVYYADRTNHCIAKLHPYSYGVNGNSYNMVSLTGKNGADWLSVPGGGGDANIGTGDGEFDFPNDVAVYGHYLYVTDTLNNRVQKFETATGDNTLAFVAKWGKNGGDGTSGSGDGEFSQPRGIDAQGGVNGHVFVSDANNHRVQEFTNAGAFVGKFGSTTASDPLYLLDPIGVDVDALGDLYVTDLGDSTSWVGKFHSTAGVWSRVTRIGGFGSGDAQFHYPWSSAVDPDGSLYVTDTQNYKLKKFARDATAPTVSPAAFPTGWTKTVGHPEFIASDPTVSGQYTSGGVSIWYSKTGAAPWTEYMEPFASIDFVEGDNVLTYFAKDAVGNQSTPATVHVYYDKTAPVTTDPGLAGGWSNADVSVTLQASGDGLSPVASTEYRLLGVPAWTTYSGPFPVSAEGVSTYEYRSTDAAGNVETAKTLTVSIDKTAPVTVVSGIPAGWSKTALTASFSPQDAASGPASTAYSTDGGATWTPGLSAPFTAQGVSALLVRSTDVAGNAETAQTVTARIDSAAPVPKALKNKMVKRGKIVMLPFSVADLTPQAKVTIKIYKGKALKKTLAVGTKATGAGLMYAYKCKLAKGKYTWKVYATDLAGNAQAKPGVKTLTVK